MTSKIFANQALTSEGWRKDLMIEIDSDGAICALTQDKSSADHCVDILLPALSNLHSHSFQRAMAGLAEHRGPSANDDFWSWRNVMYQFLEILHPDDIEVIAAQVQMEMMEAGYAAQGEFHYVHHAAGGQAYDQPAETSLRHFNAARLTGIGYTHLPVLYMRGGLDDRLLEGGQLRFGCTIDRFQVLYADMANLMKGMPADSVLGVAPHSLRAVSKAGLKVSHDLAGARPIHIHIAEQVAEITEVESALGARPVRWLLANMPIFTNWCFVHATHMDDSEITDLARSGAVAGLCPITEANLGDGIFAGRAFMDAGGAFGIGSDSNVRIALSEELRMLEVSQRLRDKARVVLTSETMPSNGRSLYEHAAIGGAQAIGRKSGVIEVGALADLTALDGGHEAICGLTGDAVLDTWLFASDDALVSDVWAAGRHMVRNGLHIHRDKIAAAFKTTITRLREAL